MESDMGTISDEGEETTTDAQKEGAAGVVAVNIDEGRKRTQGIIIARANKVFDMSKDATKGLDVRGVRRQLVLRAPVPHGRRLRRSWSSRLRHGAGNTLGTCTSTARWCRFH